MNSYIVFLLILMTAMASRSRDGGKDKEVLAHMKPSERLTFYGMASAVGLSIPLTALGIAWLIRLAMPGRSALGSLNFALIVLFPVLLIAGVWCRKPIRRYQRRLLLRTMWAKKNAITEDQIGP
jgi:hypothetical protein